MNSVYPFKKFFPLYIYDTMLDIKGKFCIKEILFIDFLTLNSVSI